MRLRAFRFLSERYDCPRGGATAESLIRGYSHGKVPRVVLKADLSSTVPLLLVALLFFVLLAIVGIVLLSIALRYRAGTARRRGRRWVATTNVWMMSLSGLFYLTFAALLSFWISHAFPSALTGIGLGFLLGLLGLALTRWEANSEGFFYTPSRWLTLFLTMAVAVRITYGWWRGFHSIGSTTDAHPFLSTSGMQLSLAVAGALIGYYLTYAIGVRLRLASHERSPWSR
jgi:hypothetical protein